jgi:hypothetical protein
MELDNLIPKTPSLSTEVFGLFIGVVIALMLPNKSGFMLLLGILAFAMVSHSSEIVQFFSILQGQIT